MPTHRSFAIAAAVVALAACQSKPAATRASLTIATATFGPALGVDLKASTTTGTGLYYRDLAVGDGPVATRGAQLSVNYTGWLADGTEFESSAYSFQLGAGSVIPGWDEGLVGMRVGGKRQLIIPADLAYGANGQGKIPPNAILVFNVELTEAK
ncbi:MAG: FKBP-type peptidyl-prolyl cis-trans isomerase [Gemmatimonadales bacterium]